MIKKNTINKRVLAMLVIAAILLLKLSSYAYYATKIKAENRANLEIFPVGKWDYVPDGFLAGIGNSVREGIITLDMLGKTKEELNMPDAKDDIPYPLSEKYVVVENIDLNNSIDTPFTFFSGILDGQGHTISNTTLNKSIKHSKGHIIALFAELRKPGRIINLGLDNINVDVELTTNTDIYASSFVGVNRSIIIGCKVVNNNINVTHINNASGRSTFAASFVAEMAGASITENCYAISEMNITVDGTHSKVVAAGMMVAKHSGAILSCFSKGNIVVNRLDQNPATINVGSIVGKTNDDGTKFFVRNLFSDTSAHINTSDQNRTIYFGKITGGLGGNGSFSGNYVSSESQVTVSSGNEPFIREFETTIDKIHFMSPSFLNKSFSNLTINENFYPTKPSYIQSKPWGDDSWVFVEGELPELKAFVRKGSVLIA